MNKITDAQRRIINRYKLMIRQSLNKDYDDVIDMGNIIVAMSELIAEISQFSILESLGTLINRSEKLENPLRIKPGEKLEIAENIIEKPVPILGVISSPRCPNCLEHLMFCDYSQNISIYVCNNDKCSASFIHIYIEESIKEGRIK